MEVLSVEKCKELDNYAITKLGIPSIVLMEEAANKVVQKISCLGSKYTIVCGVGNNGGDGLAIARKLILLEKEVQIFIVGNLIKGSNDFNVNLNILKNMNVGIIEINSDKDIQIIRKNIENAEIIIDCIFGVGLNRNLNDFFSNIIKVLNEGKCKRIAIDVPSGLNGNSGLSMGEVVKADITYTFEGIKRGFLEYKALEYLGEVEVLNIGIPKDVKRLHSEEIKIEERKFYKNLLKTREKYGHKGQYGKTVIFAGTKGYSGAAVIATEACLKSGAGLTTLISDKYVQSIISNQLREAMTMDISDWKQVKDIVEKCDVIAFGPGLRKEEVWKNALDYIINNTDKKIVLDAEGLNILSENRKWFEALNGRCIITPHPGEMSRLLGISIDEVESNRLDIAITLAKKYNIIVLLKGYYTVITDGKSTIINTTGNSKMASGGMGDCLTGIIVSLVGQKYSLIESAVLGAYIHGLTGDILSKNQYYITASDIINNIPQVVSKLSK